MHWRGTLKTPKNAPKTPFLPFSALLLCPFYTRNPAVSPWRCVFSTRKRAPCVMRNIGRFALRAHPKLDKNATFCAFFRKGPLEKHSKTALWGFFWLHKIQKRPFLAVSRENRKGTRTQLVRAFVLVCFTHAQNLLRGPKTRFELQKRSKRVAGTKNGLPSPKTCFGDQKRVLSSKSGQNGSWGPKTGSRAQKRVLGTKNPF